MRESKMTTEYEALQQTVRELRNKEFPDIPEVLLTEILSIEASNVTNRADALRRIERLIDAHFARRE